MPNGIRSMLRQLDPYDFEYLIAELWERMGYQTEVVQQSQDKGIDVRATHPLGEKVLIQAKRHGPNSVVSGPKVREYAGLYAQEEDIDNVYVVTTGGFTSQAVETASQAGVKLVDGEELTELVTKHEEQLLPNSRQGGSQPAQKEKKVETGEDNSQADKLRQKDVQDRIKPSDSYPAHNDTTVTMSDIAPNADLSHKDLSNADLTDTTLRNTDFSHTDLSDANLSGANLSSANLSNANLSGADLSNANLLKADFTNAVLSSVDLSSATLRSTKLSGRDLTDVDLSSADLTNASLRGVNLSDKDLSRTNLRGADLSGANISDTDLSGADLSGIDLSDANLSGSNLSRATLHRTDLSYKDLTEINFTSADLTNTSLCGADLSGKDLSNTTLSGSDLSGACLINTNLPDHIYSDTTIRGLVCPICGDWKAKWEDGHPVDCTGCGTSWREVSKFLRTNQWKANGGPQSGISRTAKQWRNFV